MKIKYPQSFNLSRLIHNRVLKKRINIYIIFYTALVFALGILFHRTGAIGEFIIPSIITNKEIMFKYFQGITSRPESLIIDIKHKDYQKLAYKREIALSKGKLISTVDDYVPAKLTHNGKIVKIDIRLKGDWASQFKDDKWSFRIKIKKGDTLFGMRRLSLHHPKERNFIWEWLFHKMLEREGLLALRYDFINLIINGKDLGIYALEEHFSKNLIENNKMRESPIIKFSEAEYWSGNTYPWGHHDTESYLTSVVNVFESNKVQSDSLLNEQFMLAANLLGGFRDGKYTTSEVFDVDKLAKFIAISDLLGAPHGNRWHNKRFYLNPITLKLEPVGYDAMPGATIYSLIYHSEFWIKGTFHTLNKIHQNAIFSDSNFLTAYIKCLERISSTTYVDSIFLSYDDAINENLKILYKEFPDYVFNKNILYKNAGFIRKILNPSAGVGAFFVEKKDDSVILQIINKQTLPIIIESILIDTTMIDIKNTLIPSKVLNQKVIPVEIKLEIPERLISTEDLYNRFTINYKILGLQRIIQQSVENNVTFHQIYRFPSILNDYSGLDNFQFIEVDSINKIVRFRPGDWKVQDDIIIPSNYRVISNGNLNLDFLNSAKFISYSPLLLYGSADNPIIFQSSDSTGQGVLIMNTKDQSIFEYVTFQGLSSPKDIAWKLTGAVTFYETTAYINNCNFVNNKSEDALNAVRTKIYISETEFSNNYSDAFDGDYIDGDMVNCNFFDCGNDAIDISGSRINFKNIKIDRFGDKGISLGEKSYARANGISITNGEIAFASKDFSEVHVTDIVINNCRIGFTTYQKKSEFGPASLDITNVDIHNCEEPYLIEEESQVFVNGNYIKPNRENLKDLFYGVVYGNKSN